MPVVGFHKVFAEEIEAINSRRQQQQPPRSPAALEEVEKDPEGEPIMRPTAGSDLVGLALSGGGVRSASFCLGALQALDDLGVLSKVDYLSTVSGGGYIGTSMTAAMSEARDSKFPFPSELTPEERPALRHVRDHSNYLFPGGKIDIFNNVAIYLRGIIANAILLLPYLFLAAAATIYLNPTLRDLTETQDGPLMIATNFNKTILAAFGLVGLLALWALYRSIAPGKPDVGTRSTLVTSAVLLGLLMVALYELQPLILAGMFNTATRAAAADGNLGSYVAEWGGFLAKLLALFSVVVGFFSSFLANVMQTESRTIRARAMKMLAKVAMYLAAAAVPLLLWIVYLHFSYWGICVAECAAHPQFHAPKWVQWIWQASRENPVLNVAPYQLYLVGAVLLFSIQMVLMPNANSLHRLYRDRLSKAFLFDPKAQAMTRLEAGFRRLLTWFRTKLGMKEYKSTSRSLRPLDDIKFSSIRCDYSPYQIINAALNIRGSKYANQRGRDADFFIFTSKFTGSRATGYVGTADFEKQVKELDLAAAMAISGAAASSNMGANTIKVLSPTLAILNIRLGFWLPNPRTIAKGWFRAMWARIIDQLYFLREMIGLLQENSDLIYLTDGGHIENLGIYELLRRRCRLVIAIDAEADPKMSFNSFIALQRHALIDLGTLIDLPWAEIRDATRAAAKEIAATGGVPPHKAPHGPHAALGTIQYPNNRTGILLYIKSSMTGDENDYVVDYKRRNPDFPHETTADQFFSEEQFEVYRTLGFHATRRALNGEDRVAMASGPVKWTGRARRNPLVKSTCDILF